LLINKCEKHLWLLQRNSFTRSMNQNVCKSQGLKSLDLKDLDL